MMKNDHRQILLTVLSYHLRMIRGWVSASRELQIPLGVKTIRMKKAKEHATEYRRISNIIKDYL
jgi:hypothetical protein